MPHMLSLGLASASRRSPVCSRAKRKFSFFLEFVKVASESNIFFFVYPGVMIEVAYLASEVFVLAGIVSSEYH